MNEKIQKARAALILDQPFIASLLMAMPITESNSVPTMATDGQSIVINPDWTNKLSHSETVFVLAHETMHVVLDHMGRRANRNMNKWNQAADYVINKLLAEEGIGKMPEVGLRDDALVMRGNGSAEGVYELLPESCEQNSPGQAGGSLDQVNDAGSEQGQMPTDPTKLAEISADIRTKVVAARNAAKMAGKLSGGMARLVEEVLAPQVDWKNALREFLTAKAKTDATFARPRRRFAASDFILPSLGGERLGRVVVAVDCSGSVTKKMRAEFTAELNAIRQDTAPSQIDVLYFDTSVLRVDTYGPDDDIVCQTIDGGGTDFAPIFNWVNSSENALGEEISAIVVLTDMECDSFGHKPNAAVLWASVATRQMPDPPFGSVLRVKG